MNSAQKIHISKMLTTVDKRRTLVMWTRAMLVTKRSPLDVSGWTRWLHDHMEARECGVSHDVCERIARSIAERKDELAEGARLQEDALDEYNSYIKMLYESPALGGTRQVRAVNMISSIARKLSEGRKTPITIYGLMDMLTDGPFPYPVLDWEMGCYIYERIAKARDLYVKYSRADAEYQRHLIDMAESIIQEAYDEQ